MTRRMRDTLRRRLDEALAHLHGTSPNVSLYLTRRQAEALRALVGDPDA